VGDERDRVGPEPLQRRGEDRERADAVAVVVAEDDHAASASGGRGEELDGLRHSSHSERIVKRLDAGREPGARFVGRGDPASCQDARHGLGDAQLAGEESRCARVLQPE